MKEVEGDLIKLAKEGQFDIICHGANCFVTMGAGIAKQIKQEFPRAWAIDQTTIKGDINKLGCYTCAKELVWEDYIVVINAYIQYGHNPYDKPLDYEALTLCMKKINHNFAKKRIGLPMIGAGLAGGDWNRIKEIIERELKDMDVTIVKFKK